MDEQINSAPQPKSNKKIFIIIGVVVVLALLWFMKGGASRMALERAGVDVDYNRDGTATYTTEGGTATVGGGSLPENWPSDAPEYPGATIQYSVSSNPQTGTAGSSVVFITNDSIQEVTNFYKEELVSEGWAIEQTASLGSSTVLSATKDTRTLGVFISDAGEGKTSVSVGIEIE